MPKLLAGLVFLAAGLLGLPGTGLAQVGTGGTVVGGTGGIGGVTALTPDDFFIGVQSEQGTNLSDFQRSIYFNKANCACEKPTWIFVALSQVGLVKRSFITRGNVQVVIGNSCQDQVLREKNCTVVVESVRLTDLVAQGGISIQSTAKQLITRRASDGTTDSDTVCETPQKFTQKLYVLVDQDADGTYDIFPTRDFDVDLDPPSPPTGITVQGGNEALVVNWTPVNTSVDDSVDLVGYQLLCNRAGEFQVFPTGTFSPGYNSPATQCPDANSALGTVDSLDPKFLCSGLLSALSKSNRIKVLQNAITYGVTVIAIDKHGNASPTDVFYGAPVASNDFYSIYRNGNEANGMPGGSPDPGQDAGGYCTLGGTTERGFAAVPLLGLVIAGLALARRRRRR